MKYQVLKWSKNTIQNFAKHQRYQLIQHIILPIMSCKNNTRSRIYYLHTINIERMLRYVCVRLAIKWILEADLWFNALLSVKMKDRCIFDNTMTPKLCVLNNIIPFVENMIFLFRIPSLHFMFLFLFSCHLFNLLSHFILLAVLSNENELCVYEKLFVSL